MCKKFFFQDFYIFIFVLWYSTEIIFNSTLKFLFGIPIDICNNLVNWMVFGFLLLHILFMQSYKKSEMVVIILITLPIVISTVLSGNRNLLSLWMFVVGAKKISFNRIVRVAYRILLIMVPMVIFFWQVGLLEDHTVMRGDIRRYSLGFSHPNLLGTRIFQLVLCHCYINKDIINIWNYCYIILAAFFVVKVPNSQTVYISLIALFVLLIIYEYVRNQKPIFMKLYAGGLLIGAVLCAVISIILSFIDVNRNYVLKKIDIWISGRFSWGYKVWQIYGTSLMGQKIYISSDEVRRIGLSGRLWLDNAYLSLLLRYGILVFLMFTFFYICLIYKKFVQKQYILVIILFLYAMYGIMECGLYMIGNNIFLIVFADLLYNKKMQNLS